MKILVITDKFPTLSETFVLDQVTGLLDMGHDVRIISWSATGDKLSDSYAAYRLDQRMIEMSPHVPRPLTRRYASALGLIYRCRRLRSGLMALRLLSPRHGKTSYSLIPLHVAAALSRTDWQPDAVIAHFGPNGLIVSALKDAGVIAKDTPCYTFFHAYEISGMSADRAAKVYRPMMSDGSILLPISRLWQHKLLTAGAQPELVRVCHMGVDTAAIPYRQRHIEGRELRIISVGRLVEKKAHEYSIRAVAQLLQAGDYKIQYDIIGDGPLHDHLSSLISQLGVADRVHMLGALPHAAVKEALDAADVFLLPSVTSNTGDMEGIPVSLMEAMASGLICVSTHHSGIPELIEDRVTGYLCHERNVDDIAQVLSVIASAPQADIDRITRAARDKVERDFDRPTLLSELTQMMEQDIKRGRQP